MVLLLPNDELHEVNAITPREDGVMADRIIKGMDGVHVIRIRKTKSIEESRQIVREMAQQLEAGAKVIRVAV